MIKYSDKLKDPRWQKKRLEIFERDKWCCVYCGQKENMLAVHHIQYIPGKDPWDYQDWCLITLCENCHRDNHNNRENEEKDLILLLRAIYGVGDLNFLYIYIAENSKAIIKQARENYFTKKEKIEAECHKARADNEMV